MEQRLELPRPMYVSATNKSFWTCKYVLPLLNWVKSYSAVGVQTVNVINGNSLWSIISIITLWYLTNSRI